MNERVSLSGPGSVSGDTIGGSPVERIIARCAPVRDELLRQRLAAAWIDHRVIALNNQRAADRRRNGAEAGPEGSITKLQSAEFNQRLQKLAVDLEGLNGVAWEGKGLTAEATLSFATSAADDPRTVARGFLRSQANTIEGGTSSIMRNILGERVLGLPKEPDQSRDVAWKDVPRSS
jgi:alkylation response protein AidB-like acyl-CoA dehydrogenase